MNSAVDVATGPNRPALDSAGLTFRHSLLRLCNQWTGKGSILVVPPWNLVPWLLEKVLQEHLLKITLVFLLWSSASWYPTMTELALRDPIPIPREAILLLLGSVHSLSRNPQWSLCAWHISVQATRRQASNQQQ
ncbi:hypothetical protein GGI05_000377 [Coemansia sp. RSA 2603]|nr:hypothetical protein GGI05_000377 [Coemansia sp. RSA 2603]